MARGRKANQTAEQEATSFVQRVLHDKDEVEEEVQDRVAEALESRGIPSPETEQTLADDEVKRKLRQEGLYDIFFDMEKNHYKEGSGIDIEYTLFRGHEMKGVKSHPYSWDKLQKDFPDGGRFRVVAYSTIDRAYLSQETRSMSAYIGPSPASSHQQHAPDRGSSMEETMKLLAFMREMTPPPAPQPQNNNDFMMKMMMDSNQNTMTLIMKMQENTNSMMEKISTSFGSAIKEIGEKIEKKSEKKDEGFSVVELLKMQADARKEGYDQRKELEEMVEEKAEARAELMADASGNAPKTGLIERLAESFMPVVSQSLLLQQNAAAAAANPAPAPAPAPVRRAGNPPNNFPPEQRSPKAPPKLVRVDGRAKFDPAAMGGAAPAPVDQRVSQNDEKMRVIMALIPGLAQAQSMEEAVALTEKTLLGMSLTIAAALSIVSRADMMEVAKEKLPKETLPVLEEFYTALEAKAGKGAAPKEESREQPVSDSAPSDAREHAALN